MPETPAIIVTRAEPDGASTAARIEALGVRALQAPLLQMQSVLFPVPDATKYDAVIFTSANGVKALEQSGQLAGFVDLPLFTVGDRTADVARQAGFTNIASADGNLEDLVALVQRELTQGRIYYPAAKHRSGDLATVLAPIEVDSVICYEMVPATVLPDDIIALLNSGDACAILLYSRRTAEIFCDLVVDILPQDKRSNITALCLSENVAAPMVANHFTRIGLADYPSEEAMMALALSFSRDQIRS